MLGVEPFSLSTMRAHA